MRLSRSAESDWNISTFTTISPTRLAAMSTRFTAISPANTLVVPTVVRDSPPRRSSMW